MKRSIHLAILFLFYLFLIISKDAYSASCDLYVFSGSDYSLIKYEWDWQSSSNDFNVGTGTGGGTQVGSFSYNFGATGMMSFEFINPDESIPEPISLILLSLSTISFLIRSKFKNF